jgi:hypothetical protein
MKPLLRYSAFALGLLAAWAFGYSMRSASGPAQLSQTVAKATPLSDPAGGGEMHTGSAIGKLVEGEKTEFRRQTNLHEYAAHLTSEEMQAAVNDALRLPIQYRAGALTVLFARWAELDPAAASAYANLLPKSANPAELRRKAVGAWAEKDFAAAWAWAKALEVGDTRNASLSAAVAALAKTDPAGALKLVAENFNRRDAANAYSNVFSAWAENQFDAALAAALALEDPQVRARALQATLNKRVDIDPHGVLEVVKAARNADLRWSVADRAMERWLERDFTAAREYALTLPAGELRQAMLQSVARDMTRRDPADALTWVQAITNESDRDEALQSLFSTWAGRDSTAALAAAKNLPEGQLRNTALSQMAQSLIEIDITAALAAVGELPPGQPRQNASQNIAYQWARSDPKAAANWMLANSSQAEPWSLQQVMWQWTRNDPDGALQWATALPEGQQKGHVLGVALGQMARGDVTRAAEVIANLPPESQRSAVGNFSANWASRDPAAAAKWAAQLADPDAQASAFSTVAMQWGQRDAAAAAKWIEKLPAGDGRDSAVSSFSYGVSQADPEGALAWATTIGDGEKQKNTVRNLLAGWVQRDRNAASAWLQSTQSITPELKTEMQKVVQKSSGNNGAYFIDN